MFTDVARFDFYLFCWYYIGPIIKLIIIKQEEMFYTHMTKMPTSPK